MMKQFLRTLGIAFLLVIPNTLMAQMHSVNLEDALMSSSRSEADQQRDAGRKPAEVIDYLGIGQGMTVIDLMAAGGYYTEVLSLAVGADGKVYSQNPPNFLKYRDGAFDKALTKRLAGNRLANVERINQDNSNLGLQAGSVDAAITALNFHDIYNQGSPEAALTLVKNIYKVLKPGGVLGVVEHVGVAGQDNAALHRIEKSKVKETLTKAGFQLSESNLLYSKDDDHSKMVFDPSVRGKTDRMLIRAVKPAS